MDAPGECRIKRYGDHTGRRETGGYICGGKGSVDFR